MSTLRPEKRINKNGVAVIKHVRADAAVTKHSTLPAPTVSTPARLPKPMKKQLALREHTPLHSDYRTDPELEQALVARYGHPNSYQYFHFAVSDAEHYAVLSVTSAGNALALLERRIVSRTDAVTFLRQNGLEHLISDNSGFCNEALRRGIRPERLLRVQKKYSTGKDQDPGLLLDAAEVESFAPFAGVYATPSITERVATGKLRYSDITTVGEQRLARVLGSGALLFHLQGMVTGNSAYDAADMRRIIEHYEQHRADGVALSDAVEAASRIAFVHGADYAMTFRYPVAASDMMMTVNMSGTSRSTKEMQRAMTYADDLYAAEERERQRNPHAPARFPSSEVLRLLDAGVDAGEGCPARGDRQHRGADHRRGGPRDRPERLRRLAVTGALPLAA